MAPRKKRIPKEQRKTEILDAAVKVFANRGYRKASITEINEAAGIARGTFYLYFESKQDIFVQLVELYFTGYSAILEANQERLEKALSNMMDPETDPEMDWRDPLAVLWQNAVDIFEYHGRHPELTAIVYGQAVGRDDDFTGRFQELSNLARRQLVESYDLMVERGMMRPCDTELVTSITIGSVITITTEHVLKGKRKDIDALADELVELLVRAFAPPRIDADMAIAISKRRR